MNLKKWMIMTLVLGMVSVAQAAIILEDFFDNNDLATALMPPNTAGGFYEVDNGQPKSGTSDEMDGKARLINGTSKNITGLLSNTKVNLGPSSITTWAIRNYDISNVSSYIAVTWQTSDTYTDYPELSIVADLEGNGISFLENGTNTIDHQDLTLDFNDFNGFSLIATFSETSYLIQGVSLNLGGEIGDTNVVFSGNWSGAEQSYNDLHQADYHIGALVNGKNNSAASYDIETVSVVTIPEPAVITLVSLFGIGFIGLHRLFS